MRAKLNPRAVFMRFGFPKSAALGFTGLLPLLFVLI